MRINSAVLLAALFFGSIPALGGQIQTPKGATLEARRANEHYKGGWEAMRKEAWDEAATHFQAAIDNDPKFALAYYSLGRAEMARRNFQKAITAYTTCKQLYVGLAGEHFSNQLEYRKRLEDRILELQTALRESQNVSSDKGASQSQQLYTRQMQTQLTNLQQAKDRNDNVTMDATVPYFVPMALGAAYFRRGQFAEAEREYKTAIEANPGSGETHSNLAVLYLTTNRLDQAAREVKLAEDTGFKVNPGLKDDIRKKSGG